MNDDIRSAAKDAGIRLWQVAVRLGLTDSSLSRKLRFELSEEEKRKILSAINELKSDA